MLHRDLKNFIYKIKYPILLLLSIWVIEAGNYFFELKLSILGIYPRQLSGLPGILTAPFIHSSWGHLASNSLPIITLTTILVIFYRKVASQAFMMIWIGTGMMVWLFARPSFHIGASGLVYGLIGFIFFTGLFKKNAKSIVLSLIVLTLYSGSVESMFPNAGNNISWESHLFGALVGLATSFILRNVIEEDEKQYHIHPSWAEEKVIKQYFLPRDVFEKTKVQRYYEFMESERVRLEMERVSKENNLPDSIST